MFYELQEVKQAIDIQQGELGEGGTHTQASTKAYEEMLSCTLVNDSP